MSKVRINITMRGDVRRAAKRRAMELGMTFSDFVAAAALAEAKKVLRSSPEPKPSASPPE